MSVFTTNICTLYLFVFCRICLSAFQIGFQFGIPLLVPISWLVSIMELLKRNSKFVLWFDFSIQLLFQLPHFSPIPIITSAILYCINYNKVFCYLSFWAIVCGVFFTMGKQNKESRQKIKFFFFIYLGYSIRKGVSFFDMHLLKSVCTCTYIHT